VRSPLSSVAVLALSLIASAAAAQSQAPAAPPAQPSVDDVIKSVRADLQGARADIMAKNLSLTGDQAAKFWPVFNEYQKEQNLIIESQMKDLSAYAENYATLDDKGALALMNAHFTRDANMNALRQKWLGEFQKVLPTRLAVRAMQIDRRLSLIAQVQLSTQIPLVH
jgi:Spy/CpxP family protein refolding chaperone